MYSFVAVEATLSLPILLSVYIMICRLHKILEIGLFVSSIVLLPAVFLLFPHAIKCLHCLQECSLTDIEQDCTAHSFETCSCHLFLLFSHKLPLWIRCLLSRWHSALPVVECESNND